jgi:hypothetical protein
MEILKIWRLLALLCGHEKAIGAHHVVLFADSEMVVGFGTILFIPFGKDIFRVAPARRARADIPGPVLFGEAYEGIQPKPFNFCS